MIRKLLLVGGDRRMLLLAPLLRQEGYEVATYGLQEGDEEHVEAAQADALLFPYPFAVKNGCVPTLTGLTLHPEYVLAQARNGIPILAGRGIEPYALAQEMAHKRFRLKRYEVEQANADLSAEAVVCEAMQRSHLALMDMSVLVVGYGLFGRATALRLKALGADVWIAARRSEVRQLAKEDGMHTASISELDQVMPQVDMVLNTVPSQVIDEKALRALKHDTCLLELASAPYGFDRDVAKALGLHCEVLPGLPARYAPQSAARAMKQAALYLLKEGDE